MAAVLSIPVGSIPEAHVVQSDPGPSGAIYEIVTVCATATMVVGADATAVVGAGTSTFHVSSNGSVQSARVARGDRASCQR